MAAAAGGDTSSVAASLDGGEEEDARAARVQRDELGHVTQMDSNVMLVQAEKHYTWLL